MRQTWSCISATRAKILKAPQKSGVYAIMVKHFKFPDGKVVYIGSTSNLRQRFCSHTVLTILNANNRNLFSVELLYICMEENYHSLETKLIYFFYPPFNGGAHDGGKKYFQWHFWREIGLRKVLKNKYAKRNDQVYCIKNCFEKKSMSLL